MNSSRSWFQLIVLFSLTIFSFMLASCSSNSGTPQTSNIYELNSSSGNLTAASGDVTGTKFQLTFSNMKNEVNWFSDRPIRASGMDSVSNLVANIWPAAYESVVPNAVLEAFYGTRQYIQIFCTLEKPVYNSATGELSFPITINYLEGNQGAFSNLALEDLQLIILNNATSSSAASTGAEQWSDLLYGDSCTFESAADGSYTLRITNVFSDIYGYTSAPSRNWKKTPVKDYLDTWQARFGNTSPNVAIMSTAANNAFRIQIVTLSSPAYDENTKSVSFTATPVYGTINAGEVLIDIELFIDGSSGNTVTIQVENLIKPSDGGPCGPYAETKKETVKIWVPGGPIGGIIIASNQKSERLSLDLDPGKSGLGIQVNFWYWIKDAKNYNVGPAINGKPQNPDNSGAQFILNSNCKIIKMEKSWNSPVAMPTYEIADVSAGMNNGVCLVTINPNNKTKCVTPRCCWYGGTNGNEGDVCKAIERGKTTCE